MVDVVVLTMGKSSCPLSRSRILTHGLFLVLFTPAIIIAFTQAPDGRCYLKGGSSSTSFTVTERLPPGEVIGELEVGGDSGPNGDIVLTLQENRGDRPMVTIVHQTKRIVLNGKLDKENLIGPSQLQFKVKCEKKNSNDPAIIIPVRIVVQDANDNIPMFLNAPYVLQLSEVYSVLRTFFD